MVVRSLELSNYRNYEVLSLDFSSKINILYGDNAQGKTNVLEAIYTCATTKSHRGGKDREMIKLGSEEAHIRMTVEREGLLHKIDMHIKKNKPKGVAIDGLPIRKSSELFGLIHLVSFSPEDLGIIKFGPNDRRRFLDMELCQMDKLYLHELSAYNKILNQRNSLLKQIEYNRKLLDTIEVWDKQLVEYGIKIIKARRLFLHELCEIILPLHNRLSGGREELRLSYEPNITEEEFQAALVKNIDRDLKLKITNTGPHRDDFSFYIGNEDIRKYGSQGQQRTSALSLKLAELELVKRKRKDSPVLLLDDVLSELDRRRQTQLLDAIDNIQTIITCTGLEEFVNHRSLTDRIYHVLNGEIYMDKWQKNS